MWVVGSSALVDCFFFLGRAGFWAGMSLHGSLGWGESCRYFAALDLVRSSGRKFSRKYLSVSLSQEALVLTGVDVSWSQYRYIHTYGKEIS